MDERFAPLLDPRCSGLGPIQILAVEPFYDATTLPFDLHGADPLRIVPAPAFAKENLAGSEDEMRLILDHHDGEGWLVPASIVAGWMARRITCAALEDLLLAHPLYEYWATPDERGHSRAGDGALLQWAPGIPNLVSLYPPEFLPDDAEAPVVNRDRAAYAAAVADLLQTLEAALPIEELEWSIRWSGRF